MRSSLHPSRPCNEKRAKPAAVALTHPIPVPVAYGTALVKGARIHFFEDLYGHNRAPDAALRREALRRLSG